MDLTTLGRILIRKWGKKAAFGRASGLSARYPRWVAPHMAVPGWLRSCHSLNSHFIAIIAGV